MQKPESRQCDVCSKVYDLTPKFFPRVPGTQQAYQTTCRKCKKAIARRKKLDGIETAAVDSFVTRVVSGGVNVPHTAELLESLMNYFGGVNGFASMAMKQYWDSPPGSRMRSGLLEMVVKLASKNTEQGGARKPIQLYSEDELEEEINKRLEHAVLTYGGKRYINAPKEEASANSPALPLANGPEHVVLPEGRTQDIASGIEREANRSLEAIQAHAAAERVPSMLGKRNAGNRRKS
jgi:hypothetical protein